MKTKMIFTVAIGFAIFSCNGIRDSSSSDEISGAYAREYSFKVVKHETGGVIGSRVIRDTIFVHSKSGFVGISNHKWRMNDYDKVGWVTMAHDDDRPMIAYEGELENGMISSPNHFPLYVNAESGQLWKDKGHQITYQKVN